MPKKKKSKASRYSPEHGPVDGNVIRNQFVTGDGSNPVESLKQLQEIFRGKVDGDVVQLVFSECGFNVEQALESLFTLTSENELKNEPPGASGLPHYSEIRPKTKNSFTNLLGKNWPFETVNNVPSEVSKIFASSAQKTDKRLSQSVTARSSWTGISNSSDSSSANESDLSDAVSRRNSREARHRYIADVVCHKPDTNGVNLGFHSPSTNTYENVSLPSLASQMVLGASNVLDSTPAYETLYPQQPAVISSESSKTSTNPFVEVITLINHRKKILIVLRGLPGSGKSTLAQNLVRNNVGVILSTDDFFSQPGEHYHPSKLTDAHNWNRDRACAAIKDEVTPVIIDNTNTESWEMLPYVSFGLKNNYIVKILEPETTWKFKVSELTRRNRHNVSKEKISKMLDRYEHGLTVEDVINRHHPNVKPIILSEVSLVAPSSSTKNVHCNPILPPRAENPPSYTPKPVFQALSSESPENSSTSSRSISMQSLQSKSSEGDSNKASNLSSVLPSVRDNEYAQSSNQERLGLEALMALAQLDSEDSQSDSRRTSASSSQDASGWECDEEFTWSLDEAQAIAEKYGPYLREDIPEENEVQDNDTPCAVPPSEEDKLPVPTVTVENSSEKIQEWLAKDWDDGKSETKTILDEVFIVKDEKPCAVKTATVNALSSIVKEQRDSSEWNVLEVGNWPEPIKGTDNSKPQSLPNDVEKMVENEQLSKEWSLLDLKPKDGFSADVVMATCETQTSPEDFALLQRAAANASNDVKILQASLNVCRARVVDLNYSDTKVRYPPMFDKSTITDNVEEIDREAKLKLLSSMFPVVTQVDLEYILDKCLGDHNWAMNSLLDFGHEYNDPNVQPPAIVLKKLEIQSNTVTNGDHTDKENVANGENEIPTPNTDNSPTSGSDEGIGTDCEMSKVSTIRENSKTDLSNVTLVLQLDAMFAMQLEEIFGPVISHSIDCNNSEELKVTLDLDGAKIIHSLWKKSATTDVSINGNISTVFRKTNSTSSEGMLFKDIMALEMDMAKKREAIEKERMANGEDLATRMKRQKLYNLFPGVDPTALDDIFDTNNYSLPQSLAVLEEILGHGPNGSPLFSPEVAKQADDELVEQALAESRQELCLMEDDWLTWVAVEEFEDPELKNLKTNLFKETGYDEMRVEANTHHLLRLECFKKGQDAYNRGMKTVASFYSQQGHMHTQKLREANRRAANKILEIRNAHNDPNVLDLHGLHRDEAILALNNFMSNKKEELKNSQLNKIILFVITGRGLHSANKQPKLKPIVEEFFIRGQYRYDPVHEGLFKVTLS